MRNKLILTFVFGMVLDHCHYDPMRQHLHQPLGRAAPRPVGSSGGHADMVLDIHRVQRGDTHRMHRFPQVIVFQSRPEIQESRL
jgi:hypothetical protein